eukprot:1702745-Amphidinium_carterae.1
MAVSGAQSSSVLHTYCSFQVVMVCATEVAHLHRVAPRRSSSVSSTPPGVAPGSYGMPEKAKRQIVAVQLVVEEARLLRPLAL